MLEHSNTSSKNKDDTKNQAIQSNLSEMEAHQLAQVQCDILNIAVTGTDFQLALDSICRAAEGIVPNSLASIMTYSDDEKSLEVRSSPNLPEEARKMLNGLIPGPQAASCGTAVFCGEPQFIGNTLTDDRWEEHLDLAKDLNICACWSMPIRDPNKKTIGSFAISSFEKRDPTDFQIKLLQTNAYLVELVLQREKDHQQLSRAAHYDHLTGLPNRTLFNIHAEQAIARANRTNLPMSLFYIDLDRFKQINDELGHQIGDEALVSIASRMNKCVRREDSLARVGGDEFILLVESAKSRDELAIIANKILKAFESPISLKDREYSVGASIGISCYPKDGMTIEELVGNADRAMYVAKSAARDKIQFYSNS